MLLVNLKCGEQNHLTGHRESFVQIQRHLKLFNICEEKLALNAMWCLKLVKISDC